VAVISDITRRKELEQAVRHSEERLERLVQERTCELRTAVAELEAFSYSIAHDMRAPLRTMRVFAEIALSEHGPKLDAHGQDVLTRIGAAAERMDRLITDVLDYSRIVRSELPLESVNLDGLVREIIGSYPHLHEARADIIIHGRLPAVRGNTAALTQCLSNLLENAVKFVPAGRKPRVEISAETLDGTVRMSVKDNGIGIAPEYEQRIFGMFQRLHRQDEYPGTGIGLAIVKKAVERMEGKVAVQSSPGQGSVFSIELQSGG